MFTGIITNIGAIEELKSNIKKDLLIKISAAKSQIKRKLEIGCSISCNGICLTLIKKEISVKKNIFYFEASKETQDKTNIKNWKIGQKINLEFALRVGDELGGHMVLGHIDDCVKITGITKIKDSHKFTFENKKNLSGFVSPKCSVTIDGTSLTVNEVNAKEFSVNIISHTLQNTCFGNYKVTDLVNIEVDLIARYLKNLLK
jgi:riboflavin synthase